MYSSFFAIDGETRIKASYSGHKETTKKICVILDRLKVVQSFQKKYADLHNREVKYDVSDFIFLKYL